MSYAAEKWARAQKTGKASAKAVLIELAWRSNPKDGKCCPSVDTLADCLEMDRKTVMSATSHLEKIGLICKRVAWVNRRKMVFYTFPTFDASEWAEGKEVSPEIGTTEIGTTVSGTTESGTYVGTEIGTTVGTEIGTGTRKKNSKGEQENSSMSPLAPASDELVLSPDSSEPKTKVKRRKPSTPCPWESGARIPEDLDEWAAAEYPTINASEEFQKFVGWALSKDMRYARWDQAFRNWMGNALKFSQQRGGNGGSNYRPRRQPTCPGDWENEFKGVDYTRGVVMKEFTPEESAEFERYCEEMGF